MPAPLEEMPSPYLNKIEDVIKSAVEESMRAAADELYLEGDQTPSVPDCINIAVSFDSSWKTRGFTLTWDSDLPSLLSARKFCIMSY